MKRLILKTMMNFPFKPMNIEDVINNKINAIESYLNHILQEEDSVLDQAMRYIVFSGGKRFRPLLTLFSGDCFGVTQKVLMPFACALELIHNYSLVHDDLPSMDNDDFRRGKPSCHKVFGEDIALLAGDGLLTLAFEIMTRASVDANSLEKKNRVISLIGKAAGIRGMIGGQLLDISYSQEDMNKQKMYDLISKKTGALILAAVMAGAYLGDASPRHLSGIEDYGKSIGFAFQIRDDVLDSYEDHSGEKKRRPNMALLFGEDEAKRLIVHFVNRGKEALRKAAIDSEGLFALASKLVDEKQNENE